MNPYLENMRQMQKQAVDVVGLSDLASMAAHVPDFLKSMGHAAGVGAALHVGQNALARRALQGPIGLRGVGQAAENLSKKVVPGTGKMGDLSKSPVLASLSKLKKSPQVDVGDRVSKNFYRGLHDVHPSPVMQHATAFVAGATVPEMQLMTQEARSAGAHLRHTLDSKGVKPEYLADSDKEIMKHVLQGNYQKVHAILHHPDTSLQTRVVGLHVAEMVEKSTGVPIHTILSDPKATNTSLYRLQKTAKKPQNWLTSNLLPRVGEYRAPDTLSGIPGKLGGKPVNTSWSGGAGGALLGAVEPVGGAINAAKYALSDPAAASVRMLGVGRTVSNLTAHMRGQVGKGVDMARDAGTQHPLVRHAKELALNPILHGLQGQVNEMASVTQSAQAAMLHRRPPSYGAS